MSEFVVRNGLIVSGSAYLESISQSNEAYILSYDSVTNEVAYMPTSSVVVTVPGSDTQIIYNNGGVFGASSNLVFSGSRVGIGTASPAYTLDVNGVLNVASSTVALRIGGTVALGRGLSTDGTRINGGSTDGIEFTPNNDNTIKVVIKPNGNVGIGTTNPAALLDVEGGELRVGDGAGSHTGFTFSGGLVQTNNNYVQLKGALQVLSTAGQNSYITGSGCVGIGTTNPATKLHVSKTDSSNELVAVRVQNNLGYSEFGVQSNYARILANGALLYAGSDGAQYFYYNGSVVMTVGTGNVGIGTASPAGKLHVSGTILLENNFALQSKDASGTARRLAQYTSGNAVIFGSDTSHILQLASNGATILQDNGTDLDIDPSTAGGDIILLTNQTGGSVGIGTATPAYKLDVNGSFRVDGTNGDFIVDATGNDVYFTRNGTNYFYANQASSAISFQLGAGYSQSLFLKNDGNVGVGTASPSQPLHIFTAGATPILLERSTSNANVSAQFKDATSSWYIGKASNGYFAIGGEANLGAVTIFNITTGGNVGIGTNSPTHKLTVLGAVSASSFTGSFSGTTTNAISASFAATASSADDFYVRGSVGIGITNPSQKLVVSGNTSVTGVVYSDVLATYGGTSIDFRNQSAESIMYLDATNKRAGIGTTNPAYKLDVQGSAGNIARITDGTSHFLFYAGSGLNEIATTGPFLFTVSGSERMRITTSGNVGIGTTNPLYKLHVVGSTYVNSGTLFIDSGEYIRWGNSAQGIRGVNDTSLEFVVGSSTRMYVSSSGNVGINTTSPIGKLQIGGTSGNLLTVGTLTNNWQGEVAIGVTNGNGVIISKVNTANDTNRVLVFYRDDTNGASIWGYTPSGGSTDIGFQIRANATSYFNGGNVGIGTTNPGYKLEVNGTQRVVDNFYLYNTVTNVASNFTNQRGLGFDASTGATEIAASTVPLQLSRFSTTGDVLTIRHSGSAVSSLRTDGGASFTGNVGIGINSPSYKLHVSGGNSYMDGNLTVTGAITAQELYVEYISSSIIYSTGSNKFGDATNDIQYFTGSILQSGSLAYFAGSVGIGTASPVAKLDIVGSHTAGYGIVKIASTNSAFISIDSAENDAGLRLKYNTGDQWLIGIRGNDKLQFNNASDQAKLVIQQDGNVGIGTTSPSTALQVVGAISASGAGYIQGNLSVGTTYNAFAANIAGTTYVIGASVWVNDSYGYVNASSGNTGFFPSGSSDIRINSAGTTRIFIASGSGNVGIGTTTVYNRLHVVASGTTLMSGSAGRGITVTDTTGPRLVLENPSAASNTRNWVIKNDLGFLSFSLLDDQGTAWIVDNAVNIVPSGNLGIGTTSPAQKLQVNGSVALNTTTDGTSRYYTYPDANHAWFYDDNIVGSSADVMTYYENFLVRHQDTTNVFLINGNGNVGIGTTTPNYKLEVSGSTNVYHRLDVGTGIDFPAGTSNAIATFKQAGSVGGIILQEAGGTSNDRILKLNSNGDEQSIEATYRDTGPYGNLAFKTSGSTRMYISSSGNVGINVSSPSYTLQVDGNTDSLIKVSNGATKTYLQSTYYGYSAEYDIMQIGDWYGKGSGGVGIALGIDPKIVAGGSFYGNEIALPEITEFITANGPSGSATDWNQNVLVISGSYVGIGTGAPSYKLDVNGDTRIVGNTYVGGIINAYQGDASIWVPNLGQAFTVKQTTGNVGIGTTEPGQKLTVEDTIGIKRAGVSAVSTIQQTGTGLTVNAPNGYHPLVIQHNSSELFRFTNGGNLGIGTTSPTAKLQVKGDGGSTGITFQTTDSSNNQNFYVLDGGRAGIQYYPFMIAHSSSVAPTGQPYLQVATSVLYVSQSGAVGIGTTSPDQLFVVANSATDAEKGVIIRNSNAGTSADASLRIDGYAGSFIDFYRNSGLRWKFNRIAFSDDFKISAAGAGGIGDVMYFDYDTGNVGIGTSTAGARLEVSSNAALPIIRARYNGSYYTDYDSNGINFTGAGQNFDIRDNSTTVIYLKSGGNVGIGTTNPANKLHVVHLGGLYNATVTNQASLTGSVIISADSSGLNSRASLVLRGSDAIGGAISVAREDTGATWRTYMSFYTNNLTGGNVGDIQEKMRINADGNVGIGLTNPDYARLMVAATNHTGFAVTRNGSNAPALYLGNNGSDIARIAANNADLQIGRDFTGTFTPYVTVQNDSGNVGIGTTNPVSRLHVGPTSTPGATATPTAIQLDNSYRNAVGGNTSLKFYLYRNGSETYGIGLNNLAGTEFHAGTSGSTASAYYAFYQEGSEKVRIAAGGNVGIGTTSPATKFHVHGYTTIDSVDVVATFSSDNTAKRVNIGYSTSGDYGFINAVHTGVAWKNLIFGVNGGNVGIGTTSPEARLTVNGGTAGSSATMVAFNNGANAQRIDIIDEGSAYGQGTGLKTGTGFGLRLWASAGPVSLNTGGGSTIALMATGSRIGIGTIDPGATLDVNGNVYVRPGNGLFTDSIYGYSTNLVSVGNSGNPTNFNVPSGNVGIGTTSPDTRLHVWNGNSGGAPYEASGITIENSGRAALNFLSGAGNDAYVFFGNSSAGNAGYVGYENTNNNLVLRSSDYISLLDSTGTVVRIDGGNVGIGTTNPSQKLSVVGDFAIANTTSIQESRIGKYQSGSLGSGTHTIASVSVTGVDAVFFDYVIKNSTTDMRAGTVMAVTNGSTVEYTDISTADIGDTTRITMISDVSGGNIRLRASIDTGSGSWTVRTLIRTI